MEKILAPNPSFTERMRARFFYSPFASAVTVVVGLVLLYLAYWLFDWGVVNAVFQADSKACYAAEGHGACWGFVTEKWRLILFGRFPYDEQWRPALAVTIIIGMLVVTALPQLWRPGWGKKITAAWVVALAAFFGLMYGGFAGMSAVETDYWGGLPLTVILTLLGMSVSIPLGVLLALGRRSQMPLVKGFSVAYIELVRGVPLITVLFVASFIFPLLLPSSVRFDAFWRVAWGIILFQSAYMAETVRGGLQTVPEGQYQAAVSLGLNYWKSYLYVILPQALVAVIPAFVNSLLSTFMDTSLVTVVAMFDLTGSLQLALGDANWRDFFREGYIFVAAIYFVASYIMSRYSQWLEKRLEGDRNRSVLTL